MVTKTTTSNVTKIRQSRNVYDHITSKIAEKYKPRQNEYYIRDKKLTGFWIRVSTNGRKVYGCYGKLFGVGNQRRVTLGSIELITASKARKQATKHLQDIKAGIDPKKVAKVEASASPHTIEILLEEYLDFRGDDLRASTKSDMKYRMKQNGSALLRKDVRELTTEDLSTWWSTKQGKKDPKGSKKNVLSYLSSILNHAIGRELIEKNVVDNFKRLIGPKKGLKKGNPKKRHIKKGDMESWIASFIKQSVPHAKYKLEDRSWSTTAAANYPALWNSKPTISETQRDFLLFLLLTGKRLNESAHITWKDLDWDKDFPTVTLQPEITKAGRKDIIPMTPVVVAMLNFRKARPDRHKKWAFENKFGSGPIVDGRKSLKKICHYEDEYLEIDLPETINHHDLRRTYATMGEETGLRKQEVATLLSHSTGDVTEGYITRSLEQHRTKRERIEKEILQENLWYILVNWYECDNDLMNYWDVGPQDERPKVGYLQKLQLPQEEQDKYRWK
jgi:integrase